jgi:phosphatidylglycerol---prolipoprotein diacylglyceryl transferase
MFPFTVHFTFLNNQIAFGPYGLFFFIAVVAAVLGCFFYAIKRGYEARKVMIILVVMLVSAVVGARILNAIVNLNAYAADPGKLFELGAEGFSLYGGIIFAALGGFICCRLLKLNIYKMGDSLIPFLGIGIAIMRIGCFLAGCCFGRETDLPWGVKFPLLSPAHLHQLSVYGNYFEVNPVHPTQLYELVAALFLAMIAFGMLKKKRRDGMAIFVFIAGFSLFRLFNSYLRVNPDSFSAPPYFYPALYLSFIAISLFMIGKIKASGGRGVNLDSFCGD